MQGKDTHQKTINITGTPAQTSRRTDKLPPSLLDSKTLCFAQPCFLKGMWDCDMVCSLLEEGLAGNVCLGTKMDVLCVLFQWAAKAKSTSSKISSRKHFSCLQPNTASGWSVSSHASAGFSLFLQEINFYQVLQFLLLLHRLCDGHLSPLLAKKVIFREGNEAFDKFELNVETSPTVI